MSFEQTVRQELKKLKHAYGPQGWWPRIVLSHGWAVKHGARPSECLMRDRAGRAFEVAIGAILTQNTSWSNVEKVLMCLAKRNLLTPQAIASCRTDRLAACIRSSGYYKQKAKKLKIFARFVIKELDGDLINLCRGALHAPSCRPIGGRKHCAPTMRHRLLSLWGIGPETADTILLYALDRPSFVVDAYTRRWLVHLTNDRRWLIAPYDEIKNIFESALPRSVKTMQESHTLIVRRGKDRVSSYARTPSR